ncbi:MAG: hypothetical protein QOD63_2588 [Actinomycetota bacterium]|jgi:hypothetical protein|nr:hypothetical protein [Actinomycetota bacterium]
MYRSVQLRRQRPGRMLRAIGRGSRALTSHRPRSCHWWLARVVLVLFVAAGIPAVLRPPPAHAQTSALCPPDCAPVPPDQGPCGPGPCATGPADETPCGGQGCESPPAGEEPCAGSACASVASGAGGPCGQSDCAPASTTPLPTETISSTVTSVIGAGNGGPPNGESSPASGQSGVPGEAPAAGGPGSASSQAAGVPASGGTRARSDSVGGLVPWAILLLLAAAAAAVVVARTVAHGRSN